MDKNTACGRLYNISINSISGSAHFTCKHTTLRSYHNWQARVDFKEATLEQVKAAHLLGHVWWATNHGHQALPTVFLRSNLVGGFSSSKSNACQSTQKYIQFYELY